MEGSHNQLLTLSCYDILCQRFLIAGWGWILISATIQCWAPPLCQHSGLVPGPTSPHSATSLSVSALATAQNTWGPDLTPSRYPLYIWGSEELGNTHWNTHCKGSCTGSHKDGSRFEPRSASPFPAHQLVFSSKWSVANNLVNGGLPTRETVR